MRNISNNGGEEMLPLLGSARFQYDLLRLIIIDEVSFSIWLENWILAVRRKEVDLLENPEDYDEHFPLYG